MIFSGLVQNGVVVLEPGAALPEGARVRVEVVQPASLADELLAWSGKGVDLPKDLEGRHDHYLHGQAKR